jgi:hypothetical protein
MWDKASDDPSARAEAFSRRGYLAKKNKDYKTAFGHFTGALKELSSGSGKDASSEFIIAVLEELAKIAEHRFSSPERALEYVHMALGVIKRDRYYRGRYDADAFRAIQYRRTRLERKILSGGDAEEMK